jgi:hypothetical protein
MKPHRQLQFGVIVKGTGGVTMAATPLICLPPLLVVAGGGVTANVSLLKLKKLRSQQSERTHVRCYRNDGQTPIVALSGGVLTADL